MITFLDQCTQFVLEKHENELHDIAIILPTKRSSVMFGHYLKKEMLKRGLSFEEDKMRISDIETFIHKLVGWESVQSPILLLELYDIFREKDPEMKLEKFTAWGYILLKDFDMIDKYLVDAPELFRNLYDAKNLERWKLGEHKPTAKIEQYFKLWENLEFTYKDFRKRLFDGGITYSGMSYKEVAENPEKYLTAPDSPKHYVFIGFNSISKAEEKILKFLQKRQKMEIIWDSDGYYMAEDSENKAGTFLKKYKKEWAGTNWTFQSAYFKNNPKDIHVISVANASFQAKVANQLMRNWDNMPDASQNTTALVLGDEHLLLSTLNSLDDDKAGFNITIGLSLKDSAIFNLIDTLFEMQQLSIKDKNTNTYKFNHKSIVKILQHPFMRQFERRNCQMDSAENAKSDSRSLLLLMVQCIHRENLIFLSQEEISTLCDSPVFHEKVQDDELLKYAYFAQNILTPLFEAVFRRWNTAYESMEGLKAILKLVYEPGVYFESSYLEEFAKILVKMEEIFQNNFNKANKGKVDLRTFKIFLYQAFREAKFDFDGDKFTALQVTGLNETRNIDFDNVIMLSVNESVLPKNKKMQSFIPLDMCQSYNLPTYQEQDAIVSYHFYRVLQRAKRVALVYVLPSDTYGGKEKSRFIHQLENDLRAYNPKITFKETQAKFRLKEEQPEINLIFEKTAEVIQKIKENFEKGLSPSHINTFLACSLKYYFSHINEAHQNRYAEERLTNETFGTIIHEILEELYRELTKDSSVVEEEHLRLALPTIEGRVNEKFVSQKYASYIITGQNYITREVAITNITDFIYSQIQEILDKELPFEILTLENRNTNDENFVSTMTAKITLPIENIDQNTGESITETVSITLKGITDRIDKVGKMVRIVDYKTGKVKRNDIKIKKDELEKLASETKFEKVRQLWLYKYIIAKQILENGDSGLEINNHTLQKNDEITAGIYSLRNIEEGFLELPHTRTDGKSKKEEEVFPMELQQYVQLSEKHLAKIVSAFLDTSKPFERTEEIKTCLNCNYKAICGRM